MKKYILFLLLSIIFLAQSTFAKEITISLEDVASRVKEDNFRVLENAERVYQAKETIQFSKRNLLPKLNFWNVIKLPFDWTSAIDIVQDIAPFLVPNNWFRASQNKFLFLAQKEQYRALWANEVMTAKLLYINVVRDEDFLKVLLEEKQRVDELYNIVVSRSVFGDVPPQVLKFLKIRKLEIEEDVRSFNTLLFQEKKGLSFLMGLDQNDSLVLQKVDIPNVEDLKPIDYSEFIYRATDNSPEILQFEYIKQALKYVRKEFYFSFLGASTTARNSAGNVFSNIPVQDGLGFGLSSSLRISRSEEHVLDLNKTATSEVIKKTLYVLVNDFNSYLMNIDNQNERFLLASQNYEVVRTQLVLGQSLDPIELLESIQNLFDASISLINYKYEAFNTIEKIKRTIFNGDYTKTEGQIESILKKDKQ